ncbi:LCP family protein [Blastococcus saxobsidens]|uniref:LytR family transcriptional attenuator n=1 Tax=Blastococcus saxobsidens TaxID=138336 RepID=A0A4Q7YAC1_9ACTN|nr:LCP family protein [Blastococcus saxobsidens]RZU34132.1 LytR family transcriptional attenuator [Blastococcus saxobsidens]
MRSRWSEVLDDEAEVTENPLRSRRRRRLLQSLAAGVVVALLLVGGAAWYLTDRYAGGLERLDGVFAGLDETQRPAAPTGPARTALTFLVVGSDTRADVPEGERPDGRSDVMMLVRVTADRQNAQVISLPRDSWVSIPGMGMAKLNAAYAYGGPTLLVQTVENLTGVRVDHYAAIDFQGFVQMTDSLGGVDVQVAEATSNGPYTYEAGLNHLDGDEALNYVRQRYGLPGGDFDRVKRQQQYLRSVFGALSQQNVLTDMGALGGFMDALTGAMAVDEQLSNADLIQMAYDMRSLRPDALTFLTAPVAGTGREGAQSVVYLDPARSAQMWNHLRADSLGEHAAEFAVDALPAVPN